MHNLFSIPVFCSLLTRICLLSPKEVSIYNLSPNPGFPDSQMLLGDRRQLDVSTPLQFSPDFCMDICSVYFHLFANSVGVREDCIKVPSEICCSLFSCEFWTLVHQLTASLWYKDKAWFVRAIFKICVQIIEMQMYARGKTELFSKDTLL